MATRLNSEVGGWRQGGRGLGKRWRGRDPLDLRLAAPVRKELPAETSVRSMPREAFCRPAGQRRGYIYIYIYILPEDGHTINVCVSIYVCVLF